MILAGMAFASLSGCRPSGYEAPDTLTLSIDSVLNTVALAGSGYYDTEAKKKTTGFYQRNKNTIIWLDRNHPRPLFYAFLDEMDQCHKFGMNPDAYHPNALRSEVGELYKQDLPAAGKFGALEIKITATFFLYTTHLLEGRLQYPGSRDFIWKKDTAATSDVALLLNIGRSLSLRKGLNRLHPQEPQYAALQRALERYANLADVPTEPVPWERVLRPGESDAAIPAIRRRLQHTDLQAGYTSRDSLYYDDGLAEAVGRFQRRHGLESTRVIDKQTVARFNIPFRDKIESIRINLERMRWKPHLAFTDVDLIVNVPEYTLRVFEGGKARMEMKVILGSEYDPTPIFHDTLKYLVVNPTWTVPKSIIREEFIPALREDAGHYAGQGYRFFRNDEAIDPKKEKWKKAVADEYRIVQVPGDYNALGKIKFVMPNNFSIYLHDTPASRLFSRQNRALSHGCIRVEKPLELAEYLLDNPDTWNKSTLAAAIEHGATKSIQLSRSVPVHIVYRTVWVDENGQVNFRDDVYGHDARQLSMLKQTQMLSAARVTQKPARPNAD